ncbi:hypothetical protein Tco_0851443 [Tanacetum coccineum]
MVISLPCLIEQKNWASPEQTALELVNPKQTALGKDFSNPLMVDSLPKTIWLSMHHVITMKHWLFQSKRLLSQKRSSSSKSILKNSYVFGYILQVIKKLKLKKHEVSTASTSVSIGSRVSIVSSLSWLFCGTTKVNESSIMKYVSFSELLSFTRHLCGLDDLTLDVDQTIANSWIEVHDVLDCGLLYIMN